MKKKLETRNSSKFKTILTNTFTTEISLWTTNMKKVSQIDPFQSTFVSFLEVAHDLAVISGGKY